jgi:hypothetical protein
MREEIVIAWGRIGHHIRPALPLENAVAAGTGLKEVDDISPPAGNWNRRSTLTPDVTAFAGVGSPAPSDATSISSEDSSPFTRRAGASTPSPFPRKPSGSPWDAWSSRRSGGRTTFCFTDRTRAGFASTQPRPRRFSRSAMTRSATRESRAGVTTESRPASWCTVGGIAVSSVPASSPRARRAA